jgi:hypothetical protein
LQLQEAMSDSIIVACYPSGGNCVVSLVIRDMPHRGTTPTRIASSTQADEVRGSGYADVVPSVSSVVERKITSKSPWCDLWQKVVAITLVMILVAIGLIAAGVVVSVAGFLVVADAEHHLEYFSLGEDLNQWRDAKDWGHNLEYVGAAIGIVGLTLLVPSAFHRSRGTQQDKQKGV